MLGLSVMALQDLCTKGKGPIQVRIGRRVLFFYRDLNAWAAVHRPEKGVSLPDPASVRTGIREAASARPLRLRKTVLEASFETFIEPARPPFEGAPLSGEAPSCQFCSRRLPRNHSKLWSLPFSSASKRA
ncbi:helix-turn-helix transcriptional regulator [Lichenifustis flavocetrariae]|uniref:helix-turn-helix transcriptional regulator n=1 Tax=Lichenifustis flavocetrariae TaxID=2949735 RepID=UPI003D0E37A7